MHIPSSSSLKVVAAAATIGLATSSSAMALAIPASPSVNPTTPNSAHSENTPMLSSVDIGSRSSISGLPFEEREELEARQLPAGIPVGQAFQAAGQVVGSVPPGSVIAYFPTANGGLVPEVIPAGLPIQAPGAAGSAVNGVLQTAQNAGGFGVNPVGTIQGVTGGLPLGAGSVLGGLPVAGVAGNLPLEVAVANAASGSTALPSGFPAPSGAIPHDGPPLLGSSLATSAVMIATATAPASTAPTQ